MFLCSAKPLVAWDLVSLFSSNLGFSLVAANAPMATLPTLRILASSVIYC